MKLTGVVTRNDARGNFHANAGTRPCVLSNDLSCIFLQRSPSQDLNGSFRPAALDNLEFHLSNLLIIYEKCFDLLEHCRIEIVKDFL